MYTLCWNTLQIWPIFNYHYSHARTQVQSTWPWSFLPSFSQNHYHIHTLSHALPHTQHFPVVKCNNSCPQASYSYRKETTTPKTHLPHTCCEPGGGAEVSVSSYFVLSFSPCHCRSAFLSPVSSFLSPEVMFDHILKLKVTTYTLIYSWTLQNVLSLVSRLVCLIVCLWRREGIRNRGESVHILLVSLCYACRRRVAYKDKAVTAIRNLVY